MIESKINELAAYLIHDPVMFALYFVASIVLVILVLWLIEYAILKLIDRAYTNKFMKDNHGSKS